MFFRHTCPVGVAPLQIVPSGRRSAPAAAPGRPRSDNGRGDDCGARGATKRRRGARALPRACDAEVESQVHRPSAAPSGTASRLVAPGVPCRRVRGPVRAARSRTFDKLIVVLFEHTVVTAGARVESQVPNGRGPTAQRRCAPTSVPLRRNPCSTSPGMRVPLPPKYALPPPTPARTSPHRSARLWSSPARLCGPASPWLRFQSPLVEPDVRISRIRLSDEITVLAWSADRRRDLHEQRREDAHGGQAAAYHAVEREHERAPATGRRQVRGGSTPASAVPEHRARPPATISDNIPESKRRERRGEIGQ